MWHYHIKHFKTAYRPVGSFFLCTIFCLPNIWRILQFWHFSGCPCRYFVSKVHKYTNSLRFQPSANSFDGVPPDLFVSGVFDSTFFVVLFHPLFSPISCWTFTRSRFTSRSVIFDFVFSFATLYYNFSIQILSSSAVHVVGSLPCFKFYSKSFISPTCSFEDPEGMCTLHDQLLNIPSAPVTSAMHSPLPSTSKQQTTVLSKHCLYLRLIVHLCS